MKKISALLLLIAFSFANVSAQISDTTTVSIKELFFSPSLQGITIEPAFDSRLVIPKVDPIYRVASIALSILHGDNNPIRQFYPLSPFEFTSARPISALEYSYFLHQDYSFLNHRNRLLNAPLRLD